MIWSVDRFPSQSVLSPMMSALPQGLKRSARIWVSLPWIFGMFAS